MDIRLQGHYEQMLLRLQEKHREPTATGMVRILIREAAQREGCWKGGDAEESTESTAVPQANV